VHRARRQRASTTEFLASQDRQHAPRFAAQQPDDESGRGNRSDGEEKGGEKLGHRNLPEVMSANRS
jgi:hypothetical protein